FPQRNIDMRKAAVALLHRDEIIAFAFIQRMPATNLIGKGAQLLEGIDMFGATQLGIVARRHGGDEELPVAALHEQKLTPTLLQYFLKLFVQAIAIFTGQAGHIALAGVDFAPRPTVFGVAPDIVETTFAPTAFG